MNTVKPIRRRRKEARPGELLAAALALFVDKGFAATRLDDVAARAGVSKGTLYLYYASKEALFQAVIQEGIVPVLAENEAIAASHEGSSFGLLEKMLENWWARIGSTAFAGIPKLIMAEAQNFPEIAAYYNTNVIERGRAMVGTALQRGVATGEFYPCDVEQAIDVIIAPVLMLLVWEYSLGRSTQQTLRPDAFLATHITLLRRGLCVPQV